MFELDSTQITNVEDYRFVLPFSYPLTEFTLTKPITKQKQVFTLLLCVVIVM